MKPATSQENIFKQYLTSKSAVRMNILQSYAIVRVLLCSIFIAVL